MLQSYCHVMAATFCYVLKRGRTWQRRETTWLKRDTTWTENFSFEIVQKFRTTWLPRGKNVVQRGYHVTQTWQDVAHRLLRYDTLCCDTLRCRLVAPTFPVRCVTIWYGVTRCSTLWAALCYVVWHCATFLIRCVTLWYVVLRYGTLCSPVIQSRHVLWHLTPFMTPTLCGVMPRYRHALASQWLRCASLCHVVARYASS